MVKVGQHVNRRVEPAVLDPDREYDSIGIRYGKGIYVRSRKSGSSLRTKMYRVRGGDFVYCILDSQRGPFDIAPEEMDGALVTNKFPTYEVKPTLVAEFLKLIFRDPRRLEQIGRARQGSEGRSEWKPDQFEAFEIPLPPLEEQRRIVSVARVLDENVESVQAEVLAARHARKALVSQMLAAISKNAPLRTLGEVASWSSGGTPKADNPSFYGGSIPWAIIADVKSRYVIDTTRAITRAGLDAIGGQGKLVEPGAVLVTMYGTIGNSAIAGVPMATNQAICRGVPSESVSSEYMRLWISAMQEDLVALGEGKTQSNISKKKIEAFSIRVPGRKVQDEIVAAMASVDDLIDALEGELESAVLMRESLLSALVSGDLELAGPDEN